MSAHPPVATRSRCAHWLKWLGIGTDYRQLSDAYCSLDRDHPMSHLSGISLKAIRTDLSRDAATYRRLLEVLDVADGLDSEEIGLRILCAIGDSERRAGGHFEYIQGHGSFLMVSLAVACASDIAVPGDRAHRTEVLAFHLTRALIARADLSRLLQPDFSRIFQAVADRAVNQLRLEGARRLQEDGILMVAIRWRLVWFMADHELGLGLLRIWDALVECAGSGFGAFMDALILAHLEQVGDQEGDSELVPRVQAKRDWDTDRILKRAKELSGRPRTLRAFPASAWIGIAVLLILAWLLGLPGNEDTPIGG